jgi:NADPH:quinone reductase-like Zn-dependent oxidoreductase
VRIRQTAVGVNHIDLHCRSGEVGLMPLPGIPGLEAAGQVVDVGAGVSHLVPGDRVAYACHPPGAYAGLRTLAAEPVVRLPADLQEELAAAFFLKGLTADILVTDVHAPRPGEVALVRAAAGGVGLLLAAMLKARGTVVVGVVGTGAKAAAARRAGCDHVLTGGEAEIAEAIRAISGGRGADVVYDGLGGVTFDASLDLLARRGHLVSYGQAGGPLGPRNLDQLAAKSARLSRPSLGHYTARRDELLPRTGRLFALVRDGTLRPEIAARLPLRDAAEAHRRLAGRQTVGALVLLPEAG